MTRWQQVGELFEAALALDTASRDALLAREAAGDPALVEEVQRLLAAHDRVGAGFLERPAWAVAPELLADHDAPSLAGRRIGPYLVGEEIGRGGMGVVYAAEDARLARPVALKALPPAFSRDPIARERLSREARAAAALSHPSIATVYALEEIDGDLFIASELVRGTTLRAEIRVGPLAATRLRQTLTEIADALAAAHAQGIVHRDLKPENVLRALDGRVKVVDFGIARSVSAGGSTVALTRAGGLLGTPGYMAPEQLRGQAADPRTDVFAFGVIAYELATGAHPFGGGDAAAMVERLVSSGAPLALRLDPADLDTLVRACLQGEAAARPASGAALADALRAIGDAPAVPRQTPLARAAWWWQFHQVAVTTIIGIDVGYFGFHKHWLDPVGAAAFFALLVLATITGTLRLHMWFVSLAQPDELRALRTRVLRWVLFCETPLVLGLLGVGAELAGPHDGPAAWFIVTALLLALSLIVIEPATTRASLS